LKSDKKHITIFEHQVIRLDQDYNGSTLDKNQLKTLQRFHGEKGLPYFSLIHNGVRFNEYVGIIQVGNTVIEVLPKADKVFPAASEKKQWRDMLIRMLLTVGVFDVHAPSASSLNLKSNSILDLYLELFIKELEYLLHSGLVKQYRKKESNLPVLKGSLYFSKQIRHNLVHQERFYVCYTTYDLEHKIHMILYKTIQLLMYINTNTALQSRIGALLLYFPEMPDLKIAPASFDNIVFTRKTESYKTAIHIARLLLLHYHPDLVKGRNNVLALMFDMNRLWEQFVKYSLRKHKSSNTTIIAQNSKFFWRPDSGYRSKIRPDLVLNKDKDDCVVLDLKWKYLNGYNPSPDDLRQMYVYHEYYRAGKVALIYPGASTSILIGRYLDPKTAKTIKKECAVISLAVEPAIKEWQKNIHDEIEKWRKIPLE